MAVEIDEEVVGDALEALGTALNEALQTWQAENDSLLTEQQEYVAQMALLDLGLRSNYDPDNSTEIMRKVIKWLNRNTDKEFFVTKVYDADLSDDRHLN